MSIGQCIVQAVRPWTLIAPIPFGLGVQVEKSFGSKWLVNHLSKLGFSITAEEVLRYKQSVIENMDVELSEQMQAVDEESVFVQWVADNVDHNTATLSGKGTFHGMGNISTSSKPLQGPFGNNPRLQQRKKAGSFTEKRGVEIFPYFKSSEIGQGKLKLSPILELNSAITLPLGINYNFVWHCGWFSTFNNNTRPNWSGFIQCVTSTLKESKSQSRVQFLPIIDLSPSSETCIYSTLLFIIGQAPKLGVEIPCVTFDQPLWLKAMGIIKEEQLPIVCPLGDSHTLMSFLGSIGMLMKGSGIENLFAEVYAENNIPHIMSGKAIARSLRAHLSVQSALMTLLIQNLKDEEDTFGFEETEKFHTNILEAAHDDVSFENLVTSEAFCKETGKLEELKAKLVKHSRTSKLWLLYIDYIDVVKLFIFAECTSNWELHLQLQRC